MAVSRGTLTFNGDPGNLSAYSFNLTDEPGAATSKNFLSLFNPVGSLFNVLIHEVEVETYSTGSSSSVNSMCIYRVTSASAGTLVTASQVNRFITTMPNPAGLVRYGNPTVTIDPAYPLVVASWAPPSAGTGRGVSPTVHADIPTKHFTCAPGQGIVFNTTAGDTVDRWKVNVTWEEALI